MPGAEIQLASAIGGHVRAGVYGAADGRAGVRLQEQRPAGIAQIIAPSEDSSLKAVLKVVSIKALPESGRAVAGKHATVMWSGPGQWLVTYPAATPNADVKSLAETVEDSKVSVTDLSHARTVVRVSGPMAVEVLLKGCPLDLETFGPDDCAASLLGHLNVQLHCVERDCFDVYVFRSFGLALWEWLMDATLEFGVEVSGST